MYAITTKDLTKHFSPRKKFFQKEKTVAVNRVNLSVCKSEIFGLMGPNGAGKTTLIKMLTTLILPTYGEATINGFNLSQETGIKKSIGLIYSGERSFYPRLTARQNLEFFTALHNMPSHLAKRRTGELLEMVDLKDSAEVWFEEYSSGMKQRLAIARGLINEPEIIFMDEPTKGLDPLEARKVRRFIKETLVKEKKKTVFLATHQLDEAEEICDRIAIMHLGEIKLCKDKKELMAQKNLYDIFSEAVNDK